MRAIRIIVLGLTAVVLVTSSVLASEQNVTSGLKTNFSGYIKLDASYDTGRVNPGDYARWVSPGDLESGQTEMHARQTRLWWTFTQPDIEGIKVTGKLEFDFFGGGADNKYLLLFRHAFAKIQWEKSNIYVLAGQTSDVISPLVPTTVNYAVAWWAGDIGYRRPQIRLGWSGGSESTKLHLVGAATRAIGGEEQGLPAWQGRAAVSFPLSGKTAEIGVSGHYGLEGKIASSSADIESWSGNVDLSLPIGSKVVFTAEAYLGKNMDEYLGGVGQGYVDSTESIIESQGGWGALALGPFDKWKFNVGGSMDDPNDNDLSTGWRSRNVSVWGNCWYNITDAAVVAYEVAWWETQYKNGDSWDAIRNQFAFILKI